MLALNAKEQKSKAIARKAFTSSRDNPYQKPSYSSYGACRDLWNAAEPEVVISGPAGTGKSRAALQKLDFMLSTYPGARGLIIRKIRADLSESALYTYEEHVMGADNPIVEGIQRRYRQKYQYPNGSELVVGGMDKATRILSTEYDFIYIQEGIELTDDDYEKLATRARHGVTPYQQVITDTNPDVPTHWLKVRCDNGTARMIFSTHEDNPTLWDRINQVWTKAGEAYLAMLDRLTGVRYDRYRWGKWVQAEGAVYDTFSDELHVLNELPDNLVVHYKRFIGAQDWGYTNPGVFQVWGIDSDGCMTLIEELYRTQQLIGWWTEKVKERCTYYGIEVVACDPAEPAYISQFQMAGIPAIEANNEIAPGIQRVQRRLKVAGDGRPRLFVYRAACAEPDMHLEATKKPASTLQEFPAYVWAKGVDGKPNKEIPVDDNNHGCFIAGTMIRCQDGLKPIEQITARDTVLTRDGFRAVLAAGMTQKDAIVWQVEFSNGISLIGTPDHPIYANGKYTPLHAMRYGDTIKTLSATREGSPCQQKMENPKSFITTAMIICAGRIHRIGQIVSTTILKARRFAQANNVFTGSYGKMPMVLFQKVLKSIMWMATRSITRSPIYSVYPQKIMPDGTLKTSLKNVGSSCKSTLTPFATSHQHGINPQKVALGIPFWQKRCGQSGNPKHVSANSVENYTPHWTGEIHDFVPMPASPLGDVPLAWIMKRGIVSIAENLLKSTNTARSKPVPVHVLRVYPLPERKPVYNLTVDNTPGEYFANGVLVHNCDATRYAVAYVDATEMELSFKL